MYILIDVSVKEWIVFTFFTQTTQEVTRDDRSYRELLQAMDDALRANSFVPSDAQGIAVVLGEGSFTGTRMAATIANTFAYARKIPVIGVTLEESKDLPSLIKKLVTSKGALYISATYSAEPHIG